MSIAENHGGIYKNLRALRQNNGTCEHNWFKAWGFEYKYLEEGNDIEKLIQVFESVKDTDKPTVVHIHTEKGHGFAPAVANMKLGIGECLSIWKTVRDQEGMPMEPSRRLLQQRITAHYSLTGCSAR